jgi:hypothetical protein
MKIPVQAFLDDGLGAAGLEGDLKPRLVAQRQPDPPCGQQLIIENSFAVKKFENKNCNIFILRPQ